MAFVKILGKTIFEYGREDRSSFENSFINDRSTQAQWEELWGALPGGKVKVNHDTALTYSAVWRAVSLLAGYISSVPFNVYLENNGHQNVQKDHPLHYLLHREPSKLYTSYTFRERLMQYLLLWGDGIALITRNQFYEVSGFKIYHPKDVVVLEKNDELWYSFSDINRAIPATDVIHVPAFGTGVRGLDPISVARESLTGGLIYQKQANNFFENGHFNDRYIKYPGKLGKEQYESYAKNIKASYSGMINSGKIPILENGAEMLSVGMKPENMEFLASKKHQISEVSRWFGVPPHKLYELTQSTNNNIEQQAIELITDTVQFWTNRIEQEFNRKVFTAAEMKKGYYVKLNLNGLLRGDIKTRTEYYKAATAGRPWMTPDEVRSLEDSNPLGGKASELIDPANIIGNQNLNQE